jgi:predicted transposase YdaD
MKAAIKYCLENNVLKPFFETHSTEVFNMLLTEWNIEEAKEVWFEEGWEEGMEKGREEGREEGMEKGREEGLEEGLEKGLEKGRGEIARNALEEGATLEFVRKITGLDMDAIRDIQARL